MHVVHFVPTSKILHVPIDQNTWPSICFKTCPSLQKLDLFLEPSARAFEALIENRKSVRDFRKLSRVFENHGQASKKLTSTQSFQIYYFQRPRKIVLESIKMILIFDDRYFL